MENIGMIPFVDTEVKEQGSYERLIGYVEENYPALTVCGSETVTEYIEVPNENKPGKTILRPYGILVVYFLEPEPSRQVRRANARAKKHEVH